MTEPERKMIDVADLDCESIVTREENPERSEEAVARYCAAYLRQEPMPEIEVWEDEQGDHYVVDGRHRTKALRKASEIDCEESGQPEAHPNLLRTACYIVGRGSFEAGYRYALEQTNHRNGLELNGGDKRARIAKALVLKLYVEDGAQPSNRVLADKLGVSHTFVSEVRKSLESEGLIETSQKRRSKDGHTRPSDSQQRGGGRSTGKSVSSRSEDDPEDASDDVEKPEAGEGSGDSEHLQGSETTTQEPDDDHPSWLPRYGSELQAYADDLRRVNRNRSAQTNASGPWGQAAAEVHRTVKQAITKAEAAIPVVCPSCGGREGKGCSVCRQSGWLTAGEAEQVSTSKKKRRKAS